MIDATKIRRGMIIKLDGGLYRVLDCQLITPGRWKAMMQTKLRNIKDGSQLEYRFRSEDRVEQAYLEEVEMVFLYRSGDEFYFMNLQTYEQIKLDAEAVGDSANYLIPDLVITIETYEGQPVGIKLPTTVNLTVVETEPMLKGATQSASSKPARLETGLIIQVPQFIKEGDVIKVDTREDKYLERVKTK
ncbi:MAG TPA: elongation factor P [Candidatus Saccharicenans sp.]|nr:elongation factor P [Candidatus Saccharicenans sp.]HOP60978.1 elongation factor P [Candidatus Saccharicenans sp.]HPU93298.1 elongation factor P [Candidatus Saccharicenans sp.]